ncbi:MAG: hypothetical protein JW891_05045 [Candidatus Lokiarchaeota archaeon]|nr:hypothetical protein [Candidatus Lokiarchaeota archaeon]
MEENSEKIPIVEEESDSKLFNKIKQINTPIKNELLITLLDGQWHPESELIRTAKKERNYAGAVLVGTMLNSINSLGQDVLLNKKIIDGEWHFKISNNYVGLTRAAFTRTAYRKLDQSD